MCICPERCPRSSCTAMSGSLRPLLNPPSVSYAPTYRRLFYGHHALAAFKLSPLVVYSHHTGSVFWFAGRVDDELASKSPARPYPARAHATPHPARDDLAVPQQPSWGKSIYPTWYQKRYLYLRKQRSKVSTTFSPCTYKPTGGK
jgi:hypothetical protein